MDRDLLEYVSSQTSLEASMKAETNSRYSEDPRAVSSNEKNLQGGGQRVVF